MPGTESSSALSSHRKLATKQRHGEVCVLCGCPSYVHVAHILARNAQGNAKLEELRGWSSQLEGFRKDDYENLVCFCPTHHRQYLTGGFTFVPSPLVRQRMIQHEVQDYQRRQQAVDRGEPDPGRTLLMPPELPAEFEYVPLEIPLYHQCHTATPSYPKTFLFSSQDMESYPLRRWDVSVYAVLMASYQPLASPAQIRSPRSDAAHDDVNHLIRLYRRRLTAPSPSRAIRIPDDPQIKNFLSAVQKMPPIWNTMTPAQEPAGEAASPGQVALDEVGRRGTPNTTSNDSDRFSKGGISPKAATPDLPTYVDDPVVTPAVLSSRIRWKSTESKSGNEGSMRFATSSDFVISSDELQE